MKLTGLNAITAVDIAEFELKAKDGAQAIAYAMLNGRWDSSYGYITWDGQYFTAYKYI